MAEQLDLDLPSGRLRVERSGAPHARAAICVHGLSANLRGFDPLRDALVDAGRQVVAMDLRGRGRSPDTGPGTYGLGAHAADVVAIADTLGIDEWDYVGWSMGALIGMEVARIAPARQTTLTLLDHAGRVDDAALDAVRAGLARLDAVVPDAETYTGAIRAVGVIDPWEPFWDAFYGYELEPVEGGVSPSTSRAACEEDLERIGAYDVTERWPGLTMPTLLVRCEVPMNGGYVVPQDARDAIASAVAGLRVHPVQRNHYTLMTDPSMLAAVAEHVTR